MMKIDTIIWGGRIIDPDRNIDAVGNIGINNGRIVEVTEDMTAVQNIDAAGCLVFPGLIDFHVHAYGAGSGWGIRNKDLFLATGVTSVVDQGSAGCTNYRALHESIVDTGLVRVKTFLNVYNGGTLDIDFDEILDSKRFNEKKIERMLQDYSSEILGLKLRISKFITKEYGAAPLKAAVALARKFNLPICIHVTDPPCTQSEIAEMLDAGDIICHVFHGRGETILDENGHIHEAILNARDRGVLFDVAHGNTNFSFKVIQEAIKENFLPDVLSTDMCDDKLNISTKTKSLAQVMSLYINLGLKINDVVRMTTATPAKLMHMEGQIGTLKPGAFADVAVFKLEDRDYLFNDFEGQQLRGKQILIPQMTICDGTIAFCQQDFNLQH